MPTRTAYAEWEGGLQDGSGETKTDSESLELDYNFSSRFAEEDASNPEELLASSHASCFSMALAAAIEEAGYEPERIVTAEEVKIEDVDGEFTITEIKVHTQAVAQGLNYEVFQEIAEEVNQSCPVSKALQGVDIKLKAVLKDY